MQPEDAVDEGSVDAEALQAQIDLSMSFAQDLVSSWLDPSKFSKSTRKNDLEKELTDYMRRPPRLGVGATVPAGHQASMSRETARLKGKLAGTKRPCEDEATTSKLPSNDEEDDERESKARAIKKKAKIDPFDVVHGKKKKKQKASLAEPPTPVKRSTPAPADEDSSGEVADLLLASPVKPTTNDAASETSSPKKSKKKKKKKGLEKKADDSPACSDSETKILADDQATAREEAPPADSVVNSPRSPKKKTTLDASKIPLLNLTGPPPSDVESGDEAEGAPSTPKKKRKRRKKKKNHIPNAEDNAMDVDNA